MITKEQKQLIQDVKRESGTNEFLSVSDLMIAIQDRYYARDADLTEYSLACGTTVSFWNHFLRNTPLSMDLFIGEGAIFEGFKKQGTGVGATLAYRMHGKDNWSRILVCPPFRKSDWIIRIFDGKTRLRYEPTKPSLNDLANHLEGIRQKEHLFLK